MKNMEVKRVTNARTEYAKLTQSRANMACDSCMATIIAEFDFSSAHTELFDPIAQAIIWYDGGERYLFNVKGEWVAAYIEGVDLLLDISRKYLYKLGPITTLVYGFAEYMGGGYDSLTWKVIR